MASWTAILDEPHHSERTSGARGLFPWDEDGDLGNTVVGFARGSAEWNRLASPLNGAPGAFGYNGDSTPSSRHGCPYLYGLAQWLIQVENTANGHAYAHAYDGPSVGSWEVDSMASPYMSYFAYVGSQLACQDNATSGVECSFVYLGHQLLFRIDSGSTTGHFYATDLSNNVRLVWSYASGVVVELQQRYKPFGEAAAPLNVQNPDPTKFRYAEASYSSPTKLYAMGAPEFQGDASLPDWLFPSRPRSNARTAIFSKQRTAVDRTLYSSESLRVRPRHKR